MEEFKVSIEQTPGIIKCNLDEIKAALAVQMTAYTSLEITEDGIKEAKSDLATLRKIKKAVDDERKRIKDEFIKPYDAFESQVKELLAIIDEPINMIDGKLKEFDSKRAGEKLEHVKELYAENIGEYSEYLPFEKVFRKTWLNKTTSDNDIRYDLSESKVKVKSDLDVIHSLGSEIEEEILSLYRNNDNNLAIAIKRNSDYVSDKIKIQKEEKKPSSEALGTLNDMVELVRTAHIIVSKSDLQAAINALDFNEIKYQIVE